MKKVVILSIIVSVLIHLIILNYKFTKDKFEPSSQKKSITLKNLEVKKEKPAESIKTNFEHEKILEPQKKPIIEPSQPKIEKQKPKIEPKESKKVEHIIKSSDKNVSKIVKTQIKEQPKISKQEFSIKNLNSMFAPIQKETNANDGNIYKELYEDEFDTFSKEQKEFIKTNLSSIGRITQRYLKYPEFAGKMGQDGVNVVEFYLYPNGDITDLKVLTSSGYRLLDKNSIETIEIAYKDYPRPQTKTKIRIYVHYKIY
ncbi:MAG: energy transducer TonB [Campylobacterales bacterium]|nr:energy transducer TonB [Campylobacterales bacterium]